MRLAIAARIWESGRSSYSTPGTGGATAGEAVTGEAATVTVAVAASTSRRMIRPPGPEPRTSRRSTPACAAIFLASGDAFTRPAAIVTGAVGMEMPSAGALTAGAAGARAGTTAGLGSAGAGVAVGARSEERRVGKGCGWRG